MRFEELSKSYEEIEKTTSRLEITYLLAELFKKTPKELIDRVIYLMQGKIHPDYSGIEFGVAEKLAIKAVSQASGFSEDEVNGEFRKTGDVGEATKNLMSKKKQNTFFREELTVEMVYNRFERIVTARGKNSQSAKTGNLVELLQNGDPDDTKYIVRTLLGRLRLGVADMTILDSLASTFGRKEDRKLIERAYSLHNDLGEIAKILAEKGVEGLKGMTITVGVPIKAMLAERARSIDEILERMNPAFVEYKYDGVRIQAHVDENTKLFSRRLEDLTEQFPEIVDALNRVFGDKKLILDGECITVDPDTNEMLPFQIISRRRGRKYNIEKTAKKYPAVLILFDCLYDGKRDLTLKPLKRRRARLESLYRKNDTIRVSEALLSGNRDEIEEFFLTATREGCEGIMAKAPESEYRAGARGWNWIKYKRDYKSEMIDTIDLVVVGGFAGRGRRAGTYGSLLLACYNGEKDIFETVCKVGTGFTDETLRDMPDLLEKRRNKPARLESDIEPDYWFEPQKVMEVLGAEITLSPVHTCAKNRLRKDSGLAIRFPRFTGRWREDKKPEDATTTREMKDIYKKQLKKSE